MDLETVTKLNDILLPFGYTVGSLCFEMKNYEWAAEIASKEGNFEVAHKIEDELKGFLYANPGKLDFAKIRCDDILRKYGIV